jgi:hypothetical protein
MSLVQAISFFVYIFKEKMNSYELAQHMVAVTQNLAFVYLKSME